MTEQPTFHIGLAMAGAISAGAYSGGVFDFLCEALSEWERAKKGEIAGIAAADVPRHGVCIRAMAGASAGALTGAVGLLALSKGVRTLTSADTKPTERYTLPSLYDAWVTKVDLASTAGNPDLLGTNDFKVTDTNKKPILTSVLDSTVLDWIAGQVINAPRQSGAAAPPYPWIAQPLHLYMTVTNLRGIPYGITFDSDGQVDHHVMQSHGDRVHFAVGGLGSGAGDNSFTSLDRPDATYNLSTAQAKDLSGYVSGALASSAFPIALAARRIDAKAKLYESRQWPSLSAPIQPLWPDGFKPAPDTILAFTAPDGGMIDNEPFQYAHSAILADHTVANDPGADSVSRAVIMIDPFPEAPDFDTIPYEPPLSLTAIPAKLISALKNQARFKPDEVAKALNEKHYSRYLIAPRLKDSDRVSSAALATGLLGGFGGFLDRSFRDYDYQLGRRNCQRFLMEYFTVGEKNPIAFDAATQKPLWPLAAYERDSPAAQRDAARQEVRVIPLYGSAAVPVTLPPRPRIGLSRVETICGRISTRAGAVVDHLVKENAASSILRAAASILWSALGASKLKDAVRWALIKGLIEADQLDELAATDANGKSKGDEARAALVVAAALCDTAWDYWSRASLAAALAKKGFGPDFVDKAVARIAASNIPAFKLWSGAVGKFAQCYTWDSRRPGWISRQISSDPKVMDPSTDPSRA